MFEHHACRNIRNASPTVSRYASDFDVVGWYQRYDNGELSGTILVGSGDHCSLFPIMTSDLYVSKSREQRAEEYARAKQWFRV